MLKGKNMEYGIWNMEKEKGKDIHEGGKKKKDLSGRNKAPNKPPAIWHSVADNNESTATFHLPS